MFLYKTKIIKNSWNMHIKRNLCIRTVVFYNNCWTIITFRTVIVLQRRIISLNVKNVCTMCQFYDLVRQILNPCYVLALASLSTKEGRNIPEGHIQFMNRKQTDIVISKNKRQTDNL